MRKTLVIIALAVCVGLPGLVAAGDASSAPNGAAKDVVVAQVNGHDISMQSLLGMMKLMSLQQGREAETAEGKERLRKEALDTLIFQELAYEKAVSEGFKADPAEVDRRIEDMKKKMGEKAYKEALERQGLTEESMRAVVDRRILLEMILKKEVTDKVSVSEDDLRAAYEKEKAKFITPENVEVTDISFFLDPENANSMQIAERVLSEIMADKNRDPENVPPEDVFVVFDTKVSKEKQPELYQEAKKLKVGEVSGVIKAEDGLHIIKLKAYSPEKVLSFDQVRPYLEKDVKGEAQWRRLHQWEAEMRKEAKIEIMNHGEGGR